MRGNDGGIHGPRRRRRGNRARQMLLPCSKAKVILSLK
jgi:hypothetical protein